MRRPNPIPELKRTVGDALAKIIESRNAYEVAVVLGTDQPRVSDLRRGKLKRFSLETLIRYLACLRRRVDVTITEEPPPRRGISARGDAPFR